MKNYTFDKVISREVLENYLSRAVTAADLYKSDTLEDDLRVIKKLGIKFIGRASGVWYMLTNDEEHFMKSMQLAEKVHSIDPEIILQACVFEAIFNEIETVKIPCYVFEAFHMEVENRCFRIEDTLFPEKPSGYIWEQEGGIPDLNRQEARMWFYYRATRYIDCGYEALHMGQIHLYTANDKGMKKTYELFDMIRKYALRNGRRHKVLLDAHTHGVSVYNRLLFDYHAMPFTRVPLMDREGDKLVLVREGFSEGGLNPNGWSGEAMPYLMEYDNWGGKMTDDFNLISREERAKMDWWGYDQIAWFANQDTEGRNHFLEYSYKWTQVNNVNAYFQFPFCRMLSSGKMIMTRADNDRMDIQTRYQVNNQSKECPMGFGQEDTILKIWMNETDLRKIAGNPEHIIEYGGKNIFDAETGMKLPQKVVAYGSFQPQVGAVENDSNSEVTRMYFVEDNTYTLSMVIPFAGTYDYAIATYGTLSATYCHDRFPRSGSSNKGYFETKTDNAVVKITYQFMSNRVHVSIIE